MSQETVVQFFDAAFQDQIIQGQLNYAFAAIAPEALIQIAGENGYSFTAGELQAVLEQQAELSDEQLNSVAGGRAAYFVREGGPIFAQKQSYDSPMRDELGDEEVDFATNSNTSAVEAFRSLTD
ncbi:MULTISPECIES: Nif11-like leader peptide family natural product precursor [Nostocales]|uniref:Nif11-like leader peptide family natural product n=3 Tax=Nostocales TaxID=1161 RepID=A0A8S9SX01_9CYAN|nr:Nif11-like leader peptide family natural product precursor [Tolypothrix bouteillei]KAF3884615.1 Nif11-like leader peptide family natural product precursor [Tolypothrix bouteillei VB521301]